MGWDADVQIVGNRIVASGAFGDGMYNRTSKYSLSGGDCHLRMVMIGRGQIIRLF